MTKDKKIFDKETGKYIKVATGIPLAYGTLAFVGGKLPGAMGTTMTSALAPSVGMVGVASKVGMLGLGLNTLKKALPYDKLKENKKFPL